MKRLTNEGISGTDRVEEKVLALLKTHTPDGSSRPGQIMKFLSSWGYRNFWKKNEIKDRRPCRL